MARVSELVTWMNCTVETSRRGTLLCLSFLQRKSQSGSFLAERARIFLKKAQRLCAWFMPEGIEELLSFLVAGSAPRGLLQVSSQCSEVEKDELSSRQSTLPRGTMPSLCLRGRDQLHFLFFHSVVDSSQGCDMRSLQARRCCLLCPPLAVLKNRSVYIFSTTCIV